MNCRRRGAMGWAIAVGAAAVMALATPAAAQSDASKQQSASELFDSAQHLFDRGRHDEALVLFRQAYDASKSPNARLMIGHCLVALGRTVEAYEEMSATMREAAARAVSESKYAPTRDSAATQLALLEPKVGKVIVLLAPEQVRDVKLNGVPLASDRLGTPVAVEPGTITIEATRPDGKSSRRELTVQAGETQKVSLSFNDTPPPPPKKEPQTSGSSGRIIGIVVAGVGVAGMTVFAATGATVQSKLHRLETECGGARCTDMKYAEVIDSGKAMAVLANTGLVVGIAGIIGGGTILILGRPSNAPAPPPKVSVSLSPQGALLRYSATF